MAEDLSKLNKDDLIALAGDRNVDLAGASTKAEIIARLEGGDTGATSTANSAPEGVATLSSSDNRREPSPSDDPDDVVSVTSPDGTKATVPSRMVDTLKSQGWK